MVSKKCVIVSLIHGEDPSKITFSHRHCAKYAEMSDMKMMSFKL